MTLPQILRHVRTILPSHFDHENLASDIWLACWLKAGKPLSDDVPCRKDLIYARCVDSIRRNIVREKALSEKGYIQKNPRIELPLEAPSLETLMGDVNLTVLEQQVLIHRFYLGYTIERSSMLIAISQEKIQFTLQTVLEKLRASARRKASQNE